MVFLGERCVAESAAAVQTVGHGNNRKEHDCDHPSYESWEALFKPTRETVNDAAEFHGIDAAVYSNMSGVNGGTFGKQLSKRIIN